MANIVLDVVFSLRRSVSVLAFPRRDTEQWTDRDSEVTPVRGVLYGALLLLFPFAAGREKEWVSINQRGEKRASPSTPHVGEAGGDGLALGWD
jgi:hypothetical protein